MPPASTSTDILDLAVLALLITALAFALWVRAIEGVRAAAAVASFFLLTPLIPPPAL